VAHAALFSFRDLAPRTPMTEDTIFAFPSMTKPITSVALVTLVEEGKVGLDTPSERTCPS
jgi:CubicO group peptidase (beta-lactamase class C family)